MPHLTENDLEFDFSSAIKAFKFDDDLLHKPSTLKRVDFVVEFEDRIVFLEVKDPDIPGALRPEKFREELLTGNLIPALASKYRESSWFQMHVKTTDKPVYYLVLIAMAELDDALLLAKTDQLKKALPVTHKSWQKPSVKGCAILNVEQYKKYFGPNSIKRLSDAT